MSAERAGAPRLDVLTMGRVSMDLFARDVGAPFVYITGFDASVGGSPTNIAQGAARLGLRAAVLTAVGDDKTGDFVRGNLAREGVDTATVVVKPGLRTGLAVVGVQPPDHFPLVFYRDNAADRQLTIDDVRAAPIAACRALLLSGSALSDEPCRSATRYAAEVARVHHVPVFLDLDLRPDQWHHPLAFGIQLRRLLPAVDVVIGTEEEFVAALAADPGPVLAGAAASPAQRSWAATAVADAAPAVRLLKRGPAGVTVFERGRAPVDVPGYTVEVVNTVGAGDAFAAGLLYGFTQGWTWPASARWANACGAIVVTRHGCAAALPTADEVRAFMAKKSAGTV